MNPTNVLQILTLLESAGVRVWLDGGWGVDALLGRITRQHRDLDLMLALEDLSRAVVVLVGNGFAVAEEEPGHVVLAHAHHGPLDLHPAVFDSLGNAVQVQEGASPIVYPAEGFVRGWILDNEVVCISAEVQIAVRLGYDRSEKHRQDAVALCSAFGLAAPEYWDEV